MSHEEIVSENTSKKSNKLQSIHIRILDDGTYVARFETGDFSKSKEYSYKDEDELMEGIMKDLKPMRSKSDYKEDKKKSENNLRE